MKTDHADATSENTPPLNYWATCELRKELPVERVIIGAVIIAGLAAMLWPWLTANRGECAMVGDSFMDRPYALVWWCLEKSLMGSVIGFFLGGFAHEAIHALAYLFCCWVRGRRPNFTVHLYRATIKVNGSYFDTSRIRPCLNGNVRPLRSKWWPRLYVWPRRKLHRRDFCFISLAPAIIGLAGIAWAWMAPRAIFSVIAILIFFIGAAQDIAGTIGVLAQPKNFIATTRRSKFALWLSDSEN